MLSKVIFSFVLLSSIAHAQDLPDQKAASILRVQYINIGEVTGHDLTGNNIKTVAHQFNDALKSDPSLEKQALKLMCKEIIEPSIVGKVAEVKKLIDEKSPYSKVINSTDYKTIIAYTASLCRLPLDLEGLPAEEIKQINLVKGSFKRYFREVQKKAFADKIGKFSQALMNTLDENGE